MDDEFDLMDDEYGLDDELNDTTTQNTDDNEESSDFKESVEFQVLSDEDDDIISDLLRSRGIEDLNKIKFENEEGDIEEVNWHSLSKNDKLNILYSSDDSAERQLDASEVELINAIRSTNLTPVEYIQSIQRNSAESVLQTIQNQSPVYSVDQYNDEELFVMDLISKSEDITEDEALEALHKAKSNENVFKKQMNAIRNDYKKIENENIQYAKLQQQQYAQDLMNLFAENVGNSIMNFNSLSGGQINMSNEDMMDLYNFITGVDSAGNSWLSKALQDTDTLVQMSWFALYGEKLINDITNYYEKEIANVRRESFKKGLAKANNKDSNFAYKPKNNKKSKSDHFDDLDDF